MNFADIFEEETPRKPDIPFIYMAIKKALERKQFVDFDVPACKARVYKAAIVGVAYPTPTVFVEFPDGGDTHFELLPEDDEVLHMEQTDPMHWVITEMPGEEFKV